MKFFKLNIVIVLPLFGGVLALFYLLGYKIPNAILPAQPFFLKCATEDYITKIHSEYIDLGKSFLTILVAVFVGTITFSEKIVNFATASLWSKVLLIACWILLLLSIGLCGSGLGYCSGWYTSDILPGHTNHSNLLELAEACFVSAGLVFGLALASMLAAAIISFKKPNK